MAGHIQTNAEIFVDPGLECYAFNLAALQGTGVLSSPEQSVGR